jgi:hypothetical protein
MRLSTQTIFNGTARRTSAGAQERPYVGRACAGRNSGTRAGAQERPYVGRACAVRRYPGKEEGHAIANAKMSSRTGAD